MITLQLHLLEILLLLLYELHFSKALKLFNSQFLFYHQLQELFFQISYISNSFCNNSNLHKRCTFNHRKSVTNQISFSMYNSFFILLFFVSVDLWLLFSLIHYILISYHHLFWSFYFLHCLFIRYLILNKIIVFHLHMAYHTLSHIIFSFYIFNYFHSFHYNINLSCYPHILFIIAIITIAIYYYFQSYYYCSIIASSS